MTIELTYPQGAVLVVGGTGMVGTGVVRQFVKAGQSVLFTYNSNREKAEALAASLRAEGGQAEAMRMSLVDGDEIDAAFRRANELGGGRIHTVAVAGGPMVPFAHLADIGEDVLERFVREDALGAFRVVSRAVRAMRKSGGGAIVVCTTIANYRVVDFDGVSPYSKGATEALVRQVAAEEVGAGIRCNGVAISWVFEFGVEEQLTHVDVLPEPDRTHAKAIIHQMADGTRIGRPATGVEAGNLYAFLASNEASFITGQTVRLDGGFSL